MNNTRTFKIMNYEIRISLDKVLKNRNKTRYWLAQQTGIHYKTIDSYYKNKIKRYEADSILKMCIALECDPGDIIEIIKK